jgi:hypothetical protein
MIKRNPPRQGASGPVRGFWSSQEREAESALRPGKGTKGSPGSIAVESGRDSELSLLVQITHLRCKGRPCGFRVQGQLFRTQEMPYFDPQKKGPPISKMVKKLERKINVDYVGITLAEVFQHLGVDFCVFSRKIESTVSPESAFISLK